MSRRDQILRLIEEGGPADAKSIAEAINHESATTHQLIKRMVADGVLETLPLAPRTYTITKREKRNRRRSRKTNLSHR